MSATAEQATWDEVLERDDLIGGQIEVDESPQTTRGYISGVSYRGDLVRFANDWKAEEYLPGRWVSIKTPFSAMVNVELSGQPELSSDGTIEFSIHLVGQARIYPKGHPSLLDPATIDSFSEE